MTVDALSASRAKQDGYGGLSNHSFFAAGRFAIQSPPDWLGHWCLTCVQNAIARGRVARRLCEVVTVGAWPTRRRASCSAERANIYEGDFILDSFAVDLVRDPR